MINMGDNRGTSENGLVIDNLLCFAVNKIGSLGSDMIVKLCIDTYTDDEIRLSKNLLFELCSSEDDSTRNISRKGPNKSKENLCDILKLLQEKGSDIPNFVVKDLHKLPPVSFDNIDVSF